MYYNTIIAMYCTQHVFLRDPAAGQDFALGLHSIPTIRPM
jgi:hypothetical protein